MIPLEEAMMVYGRGVVVRQGVESVWARCGGKVERVQQWGGNREAGFKTMKSSESEKRRKRVESVGGKRRKVEKWSCEH